MANPKVFLVSCGKAKPLANALKEAIQEEKVAKVEPWYTDDHFVAGKSTQDALLEACKYYDIALVLLTEDDLLRKGRAAARAPRDNCIYEAGLFTGALGLEPERCLLVSFVERKALPTDLDGIGYIKMPKPNRGEPLDEKWLTENCFAEVDKIKRSIRQLGLCHTRPFLKFFTKDQLLDLEQPKGREDGKLTAGEAVVVNSAEPIEQKDMRFARTVMDNIFSDVKYQYFFHAQKTWATRFVLLFRTLVTVGAIRESKKWRPEDINSDAKFLACLKDCKVDARTAIERTRK